MTEYPKMLVRKGAAIDWEGRTLDTLLVQDISEEDQARTDGWFAASEIDPLDHDGDGKRGGRGRKTKGTE